MASWPQGPIYVIDGVPFEWSERFGPALVDRRGQILGKQLGPRAKFWRTFNYWIKQGRRITADRVCVYDVPPQRRMVQLVGRHYVDVPEGRTPEDIRRKWFEKAKLPDPGGPFKIISYEE